MITIQCECGSTSTCAMIRGGETIHRVCGQCRAEIMIWRAVGPVGQLRYRGSEKLRITNAPVPCARAADDGAVRTIAAPKEALSHVVVADLEKVREMTLAGRVELGLVSQKTGARVIYTIRKVLPKRGRNAPKYPPGFVPAERYYVRVQDVNRLTVQDRFLGIIYAASGRFAAGRKVDPALETHLKAFEWFWKGVGSRAKPGSWEAIPDTLQVWRGCTCVRCGQPLKDPLSMHSGWGADCAKYAEVVRELPIALDGIAIEAAAVLRDFLLEQGEQDPSKPAVIRRALALSTEGGVRGDLARIVVETLCAVLGKTEEDLQAAVTGKWKKVVEPEMVEDTAEAEE